MLRISPVLFALAALVGSWPTSAYASRTSTVEKGVFCNGQKGDRLLFHMTSSGVLDRTLPKHEGPSCVAVLFDPVRFGVVLSSTSSLTPGPDLGTAITTGTTHGIAVDPGVAELRATISYIKDFINYADVQVLSAKDPTDYAVLLNSKFQASVKGTDTLQTNLENAHQIFLNSKDADVQALAVTTELWYKRFANIGLLTSAAKGAPPTPVLQKSVVAEQSCDCGNIFNNTNTTTFNLAITDYAPTLDDSKASAKGLQQNGFVIVSCATPFSASAGVEFSTIPNQQFGIVQAPGGPNNTSIKQYGYTTNSPVHTLPLAVANVRFWESEKKVYSLHYSLGVSGNIQSAGSGGSTVEFLPGLSIAFFRTMFITLGPHIGYNSVLAGGVKVGDTVATDVTSPTVVKNATVRFGVAISFTKP